MGINMQIDTSIPASARGVQLPDIGKHISEAVSLADMLNKRKQNAVVFQQQQQDREQRIQEEQQARERSAMAQEHDRAAGEMFGSSLDPETGRVKPDIIPQLHKRFLPEVASKYVKMAEERNKYADEFDIHRQETLKNDLDLAALRKKADIETTRTFASKLDFAANNPLAWEKTLNWMEESKVDFDPSFYNAQTPEERKAIARQWADSTLDLYEKEKKEIDATNLKLENERKDKELGIKRTNAETGRINATKPPTATPAQEAKAVEAAEKKAIELKNAQDMKNTVISTVDELLNHPGFATGLNVARVGQILPGTKGTEFAKKYLIDPLPNGTHGILISRERGRIADGDPSTGLENF